MKVTRLFKQSQLTFKSLLLLVTLATVGWISFSVVYFIYTVPGTANSYLYRFHLMRRTLFTSVKSASADIVRIVRHSGNLEYDNAQAGPFHVDMTEIPLEDIYTNYSHIIELGGKWRPKDCVPPYKVAFLIPFRDRHKHLPIFFRHLLPMLIKQRLDFRIFVVEQTGEYPFNRAMLFNVGFKEAMKLDKFDCFIFHDVDHIPENDRTYYGCSGMPKHYATQLDIHLYHLEYDDFFGGVSGVTTEQFIKVNGFSNQFWGWGGEDDDFYTRIKQGGYSVSRPPDAYGRYQSIKKNHKQEAQFLGRFSLLKHSAERNFIDGLNSLHYKPAVITLTRFYTNISVNLKPIKDLSVKRK